MADEYPFVTEEFGKLQLPDVVKRAFLFNSAQGNYLFTIEQDKKLSIYIIKGYVNQ